MKNTCYLTEEFSRGVKASDPAAITDTAYGENAIEECITPGTIFKVFRI